MDDTDQLQFRNGELSAEVRMLQSRLAEAQNATSYLLNQVSARADNEAANDLASVERQLKRAIRENLQLRSHLGINRQRSSPSSFNSKKKNTYTLRSKRDSLATTASEEYQTEYITEDENEQFQIVRKLRSQEHREPAGDSFDSLIGPFEHEVLTPEKVSGEKMVGGILEEPKEKKGHAIAGPTPRPVWEREESMSNNKPIVDAPQAQRQIIMGPGFPIVSPDGTVEHVPMPIQLTGMNNNNSEWVGGGGAFDRTAYFRRNEFTDAENTKLSNNAWNIEMQEEEELPKYWQDWARANRRHTALEWRAYYEENVRDVYYQWEQKKELDKQEKQRLREAASAESTPEIDPKVTPPSSEDSKSLSAVPEAGASAEANVENNIPHESDDSITNQIGLPEEIEQLTAESASGHVGTPSVETTVRDDQPAASEGSNIFETQAEAPKALEQASTERAEDVTAQFGRTDSAYHDEQCASRKPAVKVGSQDITPENRSSSSSPYYEIVAGNSYSASPAAVSEQGTHGYPISSPIPKLMGGIRSELARKVAIPKALPQQKATLSTTTKSSLFTDEKILPRAATPENVPQQGATLGTMIEALSPINEVFRPKPAARRGILTEDTLFPPTKQEYDDQSRPADISNVAPRQRCILTEDTLFPPTMQGYIDMIHPKPVAKRGILTEDTLFPPTRQEYIDGTRREATSNASSRQQGERMQISSVDNKTRSMLESLPGLGDGRPNFHPGKPATPTTSTFHQVITGSHPSQMMHVPQKTAKRSKFFNVDPVDLTPIEIDPRQIGRGHRSRPDASNRQFPLDSGRTPDTNAFPEGPYEVEDLFAKPANFHADPHAFRSVIVSVPPSIDHFTALQKVRIEGGTLYSSKYIETSKMQKINPPFEYNQLILVFLSGTSAQEFVKQSNNDRMIHYLCPSTKETSIAETTLIPTATRPISPHQQQDIREQNLTRVLWIKAEGMRSGPEGIYVLLTPDLVSNCLVQCGFGIVKMPLRATQDADGRVVLEYAGMRDAKMAWNTVGRIQNFFAGLECGYGVDPCGKEDLAVQAGEEESEENMSTRAQLAVLRSQARTTLADEYAVEDSDDDDAVTVTEAAQ